MAGVEDIIRRLVAKTMAKQLSKQAEAATVPFQHAHSTKDASVLLTLQCVTDVDPEAQSLLRGWGRTI